MSMNILTYSDADVAEIKELTHEHLEEIADHLELLAKRAIREDRRKQKFMTIRRWLLAPVLHKLEVIMSDIATLTNDFHAYKAKVDAKFVTLSEQIAALKDAHDNGDTQATKAGIDDLDAEINAAAADLAE